MAGVTYDTGALVAAERNDRRMWALHAAFFTEEVVPVVPAPVLAEAWLGGSRQASLSRLLAMCDVEPLTETQARAVGMLAGKAGHDDIVDVAVVEGVVHGQRTRVGKRQELHQDHSGNPALLIDPEVRVVDAAPAQAAGRSLPGLLCRGDEEPEAPLVPAVGDERKIAAALR